MPSVASEVQNVLTARAQLPGSRSLADAGARQASTPFADMLDSATSADEPTPAPRPVRADRSDAAKSTDAPNPPTGSTDNAAPATDLKNAKDDNDSGGTQGTKVDPDAKIVAVASEILSPQPSTDKKDSDKTGTGDPDADQTLVADATATSDADKAAALDAILGNVTPPVAPPQAPAAASETSVVPSGDSLLQTVNVPQSDAPQVNAPPVTAPPVDAPQGDAADLKADTLAALQAAVGPADWRSQTRPDSRQR